MFVISTLTSNRLCLTLLLWDLVLGLLTPLLPWFVQLLSWILRGSSGVSSTLLGCLLSLHITPGLGKVRLGGFTKGALVALSGSVPGYATLWGWVGWHTCCVLVRLSP